MTTDLTPRLEGDIVALLVDRLIQIPALSTSPGRDVLREEIRRRLAYVDFLDHVPARVQLISLVQHCRRQPRDLSVLAAVVDFLAPGDPDGLEVHRLIEQLQALAAYPVLTSLWCDLRKGLEAIPLDEAQPLFMHVAGQLGTLPAHCQDTWSAFVHLFGVNPARGRVVPPWMEFLELVRQDVNPSLRARVRLAIRRLATQWDCTEELERVRYSYRRKTPRLLRSGVLVVVAQPEPQSPQSYTLFTIQQWDGVDLPPVRGESVSVARADLSSAVEAAVQAAEERWATQAADLRIEFVLPLQLLNEPVEWWSKDPRAEPPAPLGLYHSVVLRSLERLYRRSWQRVWRQRWDRLMDDSADRRVLVCDPTRQEHLRKLQADLLDDSYIGVVLSTPPHADPDEAQEIMVALRVGIPVILWHRSGHPTALIHDAVSDLCLELSKLPDRLALLRRELERLDSAERDSHPARELSLLWDDAHHAPQL